MHVLFENLTPVCMLVIEVFQSSIDSSRMRFQKSWVGLFLHRELLDKDRDRSILHSALLLEDHTLYWSGGGAGSPPHSFCHLRLTVDQLLV